MERFHKKLHHANLLCIFAGMFHAPFGHMNNGLVLLQSSHGAYTHIYRNAYEYYFSCAFHASVIQDIWFDMYCNTCFQYVSPILKFENTAFWYLLGYLISHKAPSCEISWDTAIPYIVCSSGCLHRLKVCRGFLGLGELTTRCLVVYWNSLWHLRHSSCTVWESILNRYIGRERIDARSVGLGKSLNKNSWHFFFH